MLCGDSSDTTGSMSVFISIASPRDSFAAPSIVGAVPSALATRADGAEQIEDLRDGLSAAPHQGCRSDIRATSRSDIGPTPARRQRSRRRWIHEGVVDRRAESASGVLRPMASTSVELSGHRDVAGVSDRALHDASLCRSFKIRRPLVLIERQACRSAFGIETRAGRR